MKNLKYLFIVLIFGLLFYACEKDKFQIVNSENQKSQVDQRSYNQENCGFIDSFCEEQEIRLIAYAEPTPATQDEPCDEHPCFTGNDPSSGTQFSIFPVKIYDGTIAIYYADENDEYLAISSESRILQNEEGNLSNDEIRSKVPSVVEALINVNYRDITDGQIILEDIRSDNNVRIQEKVGGFYNVSTKGGIQPPSARTIRYCSYFRISKVNSFLDVFFDGENDDPALKDVVMQAFKDAEGDESCSFSGEIDGTRGCRYDCVDPRCVIDNLLNSSLVNSNNSTIKEIKVKYLSMLLNLNSSQSEALNNSGFSTIEELYSISQCGTLSFCPTVTDQNDIIETIVKNLLNTTGSINNDSFLNDLEGSYDFIQKFSSFENNAKANCIWDKIMESNNELMCNTLDNFIGDSDLDIVLYADPFISGDSRCGYAEPLSNTSHPAVGIFINPDCIAEYCNAELLKTILHESIHAEIIRRIEVGPFSDLEQLYPEMMSYYDDPNFHHEYMASEWYSVLLSAIKDFFPEGFTEEEYEVMAWSGLQDTEAFSDSGYSLQDLQDVTNKMREKCEKECE